MYEQPANQNHITSHLQMHVQVNNNDMGVASGGKGFISLGAKCAFDMFFLGDIFNCAFKNIIDPETQQKYVTQTYKKLIFGWLPP